MSDGARRRGALLRLAALAMLVTLVAGCAAGRAYRRGSSAARAGEWDVAVEQFRQAVQRDPRDADYKIALERAMLNASLKHLEQARIFEARDQLEDALREYRRASEFDPLNRQLAGKVIEMERRLRDQAEASSRSRTSIEQMRETARRAGPPPLFNLTTTLPAIRLSDTSVRTILNAIGQAAGISIQYDNTFTDRPYSITLEDATLEEALNQVMIANQLFFKVLNQRSILVSPDNLNKRNQYEDQVIRTFFISHADATELAQIVNQVVRLGGQTVQPQVVASKSANTITVRGTTTLVSIVERLIEANDNPRAELVIDVQILEVNKLRAKQFGLDLGSYAIGAAFSPELDPRTAGGGTANGGATTGGTGDLTSRPFNANTISRGISTADFYLAVPQAMIRFLESDSETKVVATTQLRGAEGNKLVLNLGEQVPIPTTTFTPIAQGGANFNPLTSLNYRDVGVNLEVTPTRVTPEGDIILDLFVENSARAGDASVAGTVVPLFVARKVTTRLRLRDGESNLLAGLLRETDRRSLRGVPSLLRLPVIRQLFSANDNTIEQTDIVMLLTPRIVRTPELTQQDLNPIYIGTGQVMALGGTPQLLAQPDAVVPAPSVGVAPPQPGPAPLTVPVLPPGNPPVPGQPPAGGGVIVVPPGSSPIPGTTTVPAQPDTTPAPPNGAAPGSTPPGNAAPTGPEPAPAAPPSDPAPNAPAAGAATAPGTATGGQVLLTPPGTEFRVGGGPYTVPISVTGASRLSSVTLTVTYNPAVVRVRTVQEGSFMRSGGAQATFTQQVDTASGRVDMAIVRTGDVAGVAGTGSLGALLFEAIAPGPANLSVSGVASTAGGAPLTLQFAPVPQVTVR